MTPDISLLFLIGLVSAINACVLGWAVMLGAPRDTTSWFAAGCFALALSTMTPWVVADNGSPWWAVGFNQLPMLSYALWLVGVLHLCGPRTWVPRVWWGLLIATVPVLWWTFVEPDRTLRVALVGGSLAALRIGTAWVLWRGGPEVDRRVSRVFALVLLVEALTMGNRALSSWSGLVPPIGEDADAASVLTWITMLSSALLSTPLLMLLGLGRIIGDLRQSAWRLQSTLDAMPDAVVELDGERRLQRVRARHAAQLPFPVDAARGELLASLLPGSMRGAVDALLDRTRRSEASPRVRALLEDRVCARCFEFTAAAQPNAANGRPSGYVLVCRDVTDLEQSERDHRYRNELLQHLVALSPIGILLSELDSGRIREANPAFLAQSRLDAEDLGALRYGQLFAEPAAHARVMEQLQAQRRCGPLELGWKQADETLQPVRLAALVVDDPQGHRLVWSLVEDVAEQQRVQRAKAELVGVVSHELRTPLTALMGAVGLLAGTAGDRLDAQSRQLLQVALGNGQRLRQLIDDLLDLDRMVAGRLRFHIEVQRLRPLLLNALSTNQTYGADRSVRLALLEPVPDVQVKVDGQRLIQVLGNLISNAIKFSPQGGTVELSVEESAGRVGIVVCDHGPGVPAEFRSRLFERFSQADASDTRERGGSGLGLAISREMVEHMGGSVEYQPAADGGACFKVLLPRV